MDLGTFIFEDDFLTIRPGELLASNVLYSALTQLASCRPGSVVLDPDMVYQTGLKAMSNDALALLRAIVASVAPGGQVFIPVLLKGHYTLAVVCHSNTLVKYYDSGSTSSPGARQIVARLLPAGAGDDNHEIKWTHQHLKCFRQPNNTDCGVSVFLNTMHLLHSPELQNITDQSDMPKGSHFLYWLAGRAAILEYCKPAAPQLELIPTVEQAIEKALTLTKAAKGADKTRGEQYQALSQVYVAVENLRDPSPNSLGAKVADALQVMIEKWTS